MELSAQSCILKNFLAAARMYVCIEVALRGNTHCYGRSNWAKGRDPSGSCVQCPNPAVPFDAASLTLNHTHAFNMHFLRQL